MFRVPGEGANSVASVPPDEVAIGTIRSKSRQTYRLGYQVLILLSNRQIYRETWGIFHLENIWTVIRVNKVGFGQHMKDHGFPIATADNLWRDVKFPVMKVTITFPSLAHQEQSDALVVATAHLQQLMRALWTAKGASEMEIVIHVQLMGAEKSPSERDLLQPFLKLRTIRRLIVSGVSDHSYIDKLTRAITTTDGMNQTLGEMTASIKCLQRYIKAKRWGSAIAQLEKHNTLMSDCKIAYGSRILTIEPGINVNAANARIQVAKEVVIATAIAVAEVSLYRGQYANAIRFAGSSLQLISGVFVFRHITPVRPTAFVPPYHQLLLPTGLINSENETRLNILLVRARVYMGMRQAEDALRDIEMAREIMPNSIALASVSSDWQAMFGSIPRSGPPPATS